MNKFIPRTDKKEIERWGALLEVIEPLIVHITNREATLTSQRDQVKRTPSLDNAFKMVDLDARIMEIQDLRKEIQYRTELYKKEVVNDQ